ncbi:hypothetical protein EVAR_82680_1 [Eumeta japonica]|uniref:Uncharacterized protein n=1 Tax=Eumeta variegata TaxID=151549 RepID=A0A4C1VDP6_EUMVA|nr:hypothetical protein EVAR_82680_1 [Eumeta japonica]
MWSPLPKEDRNSREVTSALPAPWTGIEYLMEGVMERSKRSGETKEKRGNAGKVGHLKSHSPDELQQWKVLLHLCIPLERSNRPISFYYLSQHGSTIFVNLFSNSETTDWNLMEYLHFFKISK